MVHPVSSSPGPRIYNANKFLSVQDIKELLKIGGYGWKARLSDLHWFARFWDPKLTVPQAKLVVGWALNKEVSDGIIIIDRKANKVSRPHTTLISQC